jgi:hypothetical protein
VVGDTVRRLPTGVFVALAVVLLRAAPICRHSPSQYPNVRILGPDAPTVFLTRCG